MRRWLTLYRQGLVGGLLAVLLTSALPAVAAQVGDALQLGKGNQVDARTTLVGNDPSQSLRIFNNDPSGEALRLHVEPGNPPMVVNSGRRVARLNADRVDNYQANQLIRAAFGTTYNADDDGGSVVTATISAPRAGILIMSGSVDGFAHVSRPTTQYYCMLTIGGFIVPGSYMSSTVSNAGAGHTNNASEDCTTNSAKVVEAGTHEVSLTVLYDLNLETETPMTAILSEAAVWVIWVPFDGSGQVPVPN